MPKLTDLLAANVPRAFSAFASKVLSADTREGIVAARYELRCGACGGATFGVEEAACSHGPRGLVGICVACGHEASIFDATQDGYDGALGHLHFYRLGEQSRSPLCDARSRPLPPSHIAAEISFSIPEDEIFELSEEDGIPAQDLFDWFNLCICAPGRSEWQYVWDFECA